ncbi:FHA domain-containing protein [Variovorax sp. J22P240]|uniref:FHA domain-containing protein n=1 Tax=unclassified Variovorax TaxID=663243 RepID=UPI0025788A68|nr:MULTISPECIES: FHA domain-containing protein [unclassified Variovorax]MDL9997310.1 FHA domain-containing protein [Variovorax sp. J22P240]MDM0048094.1 FHA domain-containing protein [Variovorax sp. J22R115]
MPTLIVTKNGVSLRIVRLREGEFRIGRSMNNHLVLASATISKAHAVLTRQGRFVTLHDFHSTNGTLVNGDDVSVRPLLDRDIIQICNFEMMFLDRDFASAEVIEDPPPEPVAEPVETERAPLEAAIGLDAGGHRIGGSRGARWVGNGVAFALPAQGREIEALITDDALASHFGAYVHAADGASRAVSAYEENHVAINVAAWSRYDATHREPIVVRSSDF